MTDGRPSPLVRVDERLTLRRFADPADYTELHRVIGESLAHLEPWMPWSEEYSPEWTAGFLARRASRWGDAEFTYAVVLDGAIVGACQLHQHELLPPDAYEIGYWLHPTATGQGVATRAVRTLIEQAFRQPEVRQVVIVHDTGNHASAGVPARLGFVEKPSVVMRDGEEMRVWQLTRRAATSSSPL